MIRLDRQTSSSRPINSDLKRVRDFRVFFIQERKRLHQVEHDPLPCSGSSRIAKRLLCSDDGAGRVRIVGRHAIDVALNDLPRRGRQLMLECFADAGLEGLRILQVAALNRGSFEQY